VTSHDQHVDVGAYVLGALPDADAARFEDHLAGCDACATELDSLMGVESLLAEFAAAAPAGTAPAALLAPPGPGLLDRLLDEVRATRRAARRRRLFLVAAALVLIVGGPVVTGVAVGRHDAPPTVSATVTGHDATDGVVATVAMTDKPWGTQVGLTLGGVRGPLQCDLVAVARSGVQQTVATWAVPDLGYGVTGQPRPLTVQGGTGIPREQIDHFVVRTLDGRTLVDVKG
jgi:Putative zinc-finger